MCPFLGDEALNLTRKQAACINGVRTKDCNFWTSATSMIPREALFWFSVKVISITPRPKIRGLKFLPFGHSRVALEQNPNPTQLNHDKAYFTQKSADVPLDNAAICLV
jgi:hypothetical protein